MLDENEQSHDRSLHQYGRVIEELDQMLKQNETDIQNPKHVSKQVHESKKSPREDTSQPQHVGSNSATGIEEFDELLDGGFPKGAVVLLAGSSGSGKTIFASQWLFEGVKNNENGVYVTLTEPLFKIVENLEKMSYYDREAIEQEKLKIVDLRDTYSGKGFNPKEILDFIEEQVKQTNAKRLCIDSITAIAYHYNDKSQIRTFIFELGKILATLGCTTILTSEVADPDKYSMYEVEEFISDAILRLDQIQVKDDFQRTMRIVKVRGKSYKAEAIPLKITADGIRFFPKTHSSLKHHSTGEKISTGNTVLDDMLMGGAIQGSTTLAAGSTGTGKTLLSLQFIMDGLKKGETCLYAGFEESKDQLLRNAKSFGWDLKKYEENGLLTFRCVYPGNKLLEEHFKEIKQIVGDENVKRCVVDSLSSISHAFDEDSFSSFAIRLNGYLKVHDVTSYFTTTTGALIGSATLEEGNLSTLTDSIIMLRYVEMQGKLESVINILKMRGSSHCKDLRKYEITDEGVVIGSSLSDYEGVMTGSSKKIRELEEEGEKLKKIIKEKEEMEKELVESEERFRDISQNMGDWVWETNEKGEYTFASGNVKEILGYDPSELIGMTPFDLMPEDEVIRVDEIFKRLISERKPIIDLENWNLTKEGKKVCLMTSGKPLLDESGRLVGYRGVDKDITARMQAEAEIKEIKDHFQKMFNNMVDPVVIVDSKGKFLDVNDKVEEITGFKREELIGKNFLKIKIATKKGKAILIKNLARRMLGKTLKPYEVDLLTKEGEKLSFEVNAARIDYYGRPADIVSFRDVSWRKGSEKKLLESEEKYHNLYSSMNEGVCLHEVIYDESGNAVDYKILDVNSAYESILDLKRDDVVGKNATDVYGIDEPPYLDIYAKVAESGEPTSFETYFQPMDKHFRISVFSPKKRQFATTFSDITKQKQKEKKLQEAKKILTTVNKNLEKKVEDRTAEVEAGGGIYRALLENIPQKIFHKNKNLEYVYSNEKFARDFNLVPNELIGKTDYDLLPKELAEKHWENDKRIIETGATEEITEKFVKDGQEFDVDVTKTPIKDNRGKIIGVLGIFLESTIQTNEKRKLQEDKEYHKFEVENSVGGGKDD